ncbi:unnamed protein product (macronuclear) [Paramecium tetraurelia]|uniref:Cation-transporting P-type ATPase C-terminal domain-containing protein n=1 Tax=Paramecium tetraurelia TaxID=5888 RepID=A0E3A4_PARTE|nr:uncharacterized protein GSPATT00022944001 [Paramecium tetraurelia]CAK89771.1 unnamed protein product [Paramecium tetraurelia]|eukprot:XP_001457168.1 hypothetical protein (macronuclear) [Paramecium tetraurelia strain d4-2]
MNKGIFTAFVGDGCNDICALQQSDIGLALSNQEASLAAPFLTPIIRVSQICEILKVGRGSLITSQSCFKFMTLYSSIQTIALTICYVSNTKLTVEQFLYQDLWILIPIAFTMSLTKPSETLTIEMPFVSLLSRSIIFSVIGQLLICCCCQLISFSTYDQTQITPLNMDFVNPINTQQIILGNTQVIAVAIAYSQGKPFRQPIYRNYFLLFFLFIGMVVHVSLIIKPNIVNISILSELTSEQLMITSLMNVPVFVAVILFENLCIKQYKT